MRVALCTRIPRKKIPALPWGEDCSIFLPMAARPQLPGIARPRLPGIASCRAQGRDSSQQKNVEVGGLDNREKIFPVVLWDNCLKFRRTCPAEPRLPGIAGPRQHRSLQPACTRI